MSLIGKYPLVFIGGAVLVFGILVAIFSRLLSAGDDPGQLPEKRTGHSLTLLSIVIGLTLIILGIATGSSVPQ